MMITNEGVSIQIRVSDISTIGRNTSGGKVINLDEGVKVAKIAKVRSTENMEATDDVVEEESDDTTIEE